MSKIAIVLLSFIFVQGAYSQNIGEPVNLGPGIGDTLKVQQEDTLALFPAMEKFKWAVFFLNSDSILNARVAFENGRGILSDTVIMDCGTLRSLSSEIRKAGLSSADSAKVVLDDGSLISGEILGETGTRIVVYSKHLGQMSIQRSGVRKVVRRKTVESGGYYGLVTDPNTTRAFLMPTASTVPAGKGYVGDYELIFFTAAVGVTDWLMINAGTLLLPLPAEDMIFDYGIKARLYQVPNKFGFAVGVQMFGGHLIEDASGIAYGIASFGNDDSRLNLAVGDAFSGTGGETLFGLSGDVRVSESIKLMMETWKVGSVSVMPLVVGVRFFGSRLSGDLGLLYLLNAHLGSPIGIPIASITYCF